MIQSTPCLGPGGTVYVGSGDRKLYALREGKKLWEFKTGGEVNSSPCVGPDGTVYVGSDDCYIYAISPKEDILQETISGATSSPEEQQSTIYAEENVVIIDGVKLQKREQAP